MSKDKKRSYFPNEEYKKYVPINEVIIGAPGEEFPNVPPQLQAGPIELPELDVDNEYKIVAEDGTVYAMHAGDYPLARAHNTSLFHNAIMYDINNGRRYKYSQDGINIIEDLEIEDDEYLEYPYTFTTDFYGKYKINSLGKKEITREPISFEDIMLVLHTPFLYFNKIKIERNVMNKLISCTLQENGQFDEKFIVKPKSPDSPLLNEYLITLSNLVEKEIGDSGEVDNIEDLEKKAYESVGYNKPLEVVLNEAKDFSEYFRFLLVKKDKIVINEEDYNYSKTLLEAVKNKWSFKSSRAKVNKVFSFENDKYSKLFSFSQIVDRFDESDNKVLISLFLNVPNILKTLSYLEDNNLDIKIGMIYEMINSNYNSKSKTVCFSLVVTDPYYNSRMIDLKSTTVMKFKNRFIETISNFDKVYFDNKLTLSTKELRNFNSI